MSDPTNEPPSEDFSVFSPLFSASHPASTSIDDFEPIFDYPPAKRPCPDSPTPSELDQLNDWISIDPEQPSGIPIPTPLPQLDLSGAKESIEPQPSPLQEETQRTENVTARQGVMISLADLIHKPIGGKQLSLADVRGQTDAQAMTSISPSSFLANLGGCKTHPCFAATKSFALPAVPPFAFAQSSTGSTATSYVFNMSPLVCARNSFTSPSPVLQSPLISSSIPFLGPASSFMPSKRKYERSPFAVADDLTLFASPIKDPSHMIARKVKPGTIVLKSNIDVRESIKKINATVTHINSVSVLDKGKLSKASPSLRMNISMVMSPPS